MDMIKKTTIKYITVLCTLLLFACPSNDEDCFDIGSTTRVDDLITLLPKQDVYNQGDQITLKLEIPATNNYYGQEINLFTQTNDFSARIVLAFNQLFIGNTIEYIKGSQNNYINWFHAFYNLETDSYELEVIVTLNKLGDYSFRTDDSIHFNGADDCNRYRLDTNVVWAGGISDVEFSVVE